MAICVVRMCNTPRDLGRRFCTRHRYLMERYGSPADPRKRVACERCNTKFAPKRVGQRFCAESCARAADSARRSTRRPPVEPFERLAVFRRDRWRCVECGRNIDRKLAWPDPASSALAHLVPITAGGRHSFENCRAAHLACVETLEMEVAA